MPIELPVDSGSVQALGDGMACVRNKAVDIELAHAPVLVPEAVHPLQPPQQIDGICVSWFDAAG